MGRIPPGYPTRGLCEACHTRGVEPRDDNRAPEEFSLRADWSDAENVPALPVNQYATTVGLRSGGGGPDGVYLVVGHISPPVLVGNSDEIREQFKALGGKQKVAVHARLLLTRDRLGELIDVLTVAARHLDEAEAVSRKEVVPDE